MIIPFLVGFSLVGAPTEPPTVSTPPANLVEIGFDNFGVPHVLANTDEGAFFGAGWVAARDRWFQMNVERLRARGRLAQYFGAGLNDAYLDSDVKARIWDWERHADRIAANLAAEPKAMMEAYCDGVNEYVNSAGATFHPMFATYGIPSQDPWLPRDCILVWVQLGNNFVENGLGEVGVQKILDDNPQATTDPQKLELLYGQTQLVDHAAVVQEGDVPQATRNQQQNYATSNGVNQHVRVGLGPYVPSFSEAAVVQASQVDMQGHTGTSLLWGGPRVQVYAPNLFYEWHMRGETFDVRGIGVAGSPNILIGSSHRDPSDGESFAWSMTAAGTDLGDLYRLTPTTLPDGSEGYLLDGNQRGYSPDQTVQVTVRGNPGSVPAFFTTVDVLQRGTAWGPVVTELLNAAHIGSEDYAACYSPVSTVVVPAAAGGVLPILGMYRATNLQEWWRALDFYSFPSANMVFASSGGSIGYTVTGAVPVRRASDRWAGILPRGGSDWSNRWQTHLPGWLQPRVTDPAQGFLYTANHLPAGSWYPMLCYYKGLGDGGRSYRLRKFHEAAGAGLSYDDVRDLGKDRVRSVADSFTEYAIELRDNQGATLDPTTTLALSYLEPWWQAGGELDGASIGAVVAHFMAGTADALDPAFKAMMPASIAADYGARDFGLMNMLAEIHRGLNLVPRRDISADEETAINVFISDAWRKCWAEYGGPIGQWTSKYQAQYFAFGSTHPFGPLGRRGQVLRWGNLGFRAAPLPRDPANQNVQSADFWVPFGPNIAGGGASMADIHNAAFNQFVELGVTDGAESMLGFGTSEHPTDPHFSSHLGRWDVGDLDPAPTSDAGMTSVGVDLMNMLQFSYP